MDHKDFESWQRRSHFDALDREGKDEIPHPDDLEAAGWREFWEDECSAYAAEALRKTEADANNAEWRRWHK